MSAAGRRGTKHDAQDNGNSKVRSVSMTSVSIVFDSHTNKSFDSRSIKANTARRWSADRHHSGPAKSISISGKLLALGRRNSIGAIGLEVYDISATSSVTWKGRPASKGKGTWCTTEAM